MRFDFPSRRLILACAVASVALPGMAIAREGAQPGKPAPDFTATDSKGNTVSLSSFKGRTVVLEWNNPECPYVRKHYGSGAMQALQKDATASGVVWLTINSGAPGLQGHLKGLEAEQMLAEQKAAPTAYLLDADGIVGRAYGATVTPHMFVIRKDGILAYQGAIDDKPSSNPADIATARPHTREALAALAAGKAVAPASTRPYGCTIKYGSPKS